MKLISLIFLILLAPATYGAPGDYLTSFKVSVYKVAVSDDSDCSGLTTIIDNGATAVEVDLYNNPVFGTAQVDIGTYHCVVLEISNNMKFTPGPANTFAGAGNCAVGVETTVDFSTFGLNTRLIDGTLGGIATRMALHFTTNTDADGSGNYFLPNNGSNKNGVNITNPLVISNATASTFKIDFQDITAAVDDSSAGECNLVDILFTFQEN